MKLLDIKSFKLANIQLIIAIASLGGTSFLIPILLQSQFKMTPLQTGLMTFPVATGAIFIRPFISKIISTLGYRKTLFINPLLLSLSVFLLQFVNDKSFYLIIIFCFLFGIFYTLQISVCSILGYLDVKPSQQSGATSFQSTSLQFSMNLAICFSAIGLNLFLDHSHSILGSLDNHLTVLQSFRNCFLIMSLIGLLNSFIALFLDKKIGMKENLIK